MPTIMPLVQKVLNLPFLSGARQIYGYHFNSHAKRTYLLFWLACKLYLWRGYCLPFKPNIYLLFELECKRILSLTFCLTSKRAVCPLWLLWKSGLCLAFYIFFLFLYKSDLCIPIYCLPRRQNSLQNNLEKGWCTVNQIWLWRGGKFSLIAESM